jgi:hypothetical protein
VAINDKSNGTLDVYHQLTKISIKTRTSTQGDFHQENYLPSSFAKVKAKILVRSIFKILNIMLGIFAIGRQ